MNKGIYDYLKDLRAANIELTNAENSIQIETQKYNEAIAPHKATISAQKEKIAEIRDISVFAGLKEILNQLAKIWETSPEDLDISYDTSYDFTTYYNNAKENAKRFNNIRANARQIVALNFLIACRRNKVKGLPNAFTKIKSCIPIDTIQLDNKPLSLHMEAQLFETDGTDFDVKLTIDDIDQLLLKFPLHSLIDMESGEVKSDEAQAIINAGEIHRKQILNQTM